MCLSIGNVARHMYLQMTLNFLYLVREVVQKTAHKDLLRNECKSNTCIPQGKPQRPVILMPITKL